MDVIDINNYALRDRLAAGECLDTDPAIDYRYAKASQDWESDSEFVRFIRFTTTFRLINRRAEGERGAPISYQGSHTRNWNGGVRQSQAGKLCSSYGFSKDISTCLLRPPSP